MKEGWLTTAPGDEVSGSWEGMKPGGMTEKTYGFTHAA